MSNSKKLSFREMTRAALETLQERRGSSVQAIGKYIGQTYGIDMEKSKVHLKRYLIKAVEKGEVVQTKGKGCSGSFKLPAKEKAKDKMKDKVKTKQKENKVVKDSGDVDSMKKSVKAKSGPKASAKAKSKKALKLVTDEKSTKNDKSIMKPKEKKSKVAKGKESAKSKAKKDKAKIVLKRASLIGGMVTKKKMPKTSKPKELTTEGA